MISVHLWGPRVPFFILSRIDVSIVFLWILEAFLKLLACGLGIFDLSIDVAYELIKELKMRGGCDDHMRVRDE